MTAFKVILILIVFCIFLSFLCFFINNKNKKLKKEKELTLTELWEKEKSKFKEEREELLKKYAEESEKIEKSRKLLREAVILEEESCRNKLNLLQSQIKEKENFNNSLLKIREEELDRIIEEKRKEKEKTMDAHLKLEEERKTLTLNAQFAQFSAEQDKEKAQILKELDKIREEFDEYRSQREAINLAILREKELQEKQDFFKIVIKDNDIEDIEVLKSISPRLRNREALNKLVYEVFVKRPLNELIKRVTGGREISGIYKITYIKTGEAYIGKTTNISTRWQNHIKTACGLEGAARTTFHNRLEQDGIWNYTFEILEEVPKDKLGEKEKFYINLYGTDKQMNMRKG